MKSLYRWGLACMVCGTLAGITTPTFAEEVVVPAIAPAEEEGAMGNFFKGIEVSGFVDTYYSYNFAEPHDQRGSTFSNVRDDDTKGFTDVRAFDRENDSFTLDNIEISVFKPSTEKDPIGFGFTTNYGEIAQRLTFVPSDGRVDGASGGDDFTVSQGFVTYKAPVGKGLDFKFGKFATWIGAELWESVDNPNFSRSLLYQMAIPFTNTGLSMSYPLLDQLTATFYLVNGWDTFVDNNNSKTLGYQFNWKISENTNFIVNGSHGAEQDEDLVADAEGNWRHFWDLILAFKPLPKTSVNVNFDYGTEEGGAMLATTGRNGTWAGISTILGYDFTDSVGVALRGEYFEDKDGARMGIDNLDIWETTLTTNIKIRQNLLVRPEIRYDQANQGIFGGTDNELTTAIDVAYMF
ncbi:MAG: porin [Planctomycetota bacterium]